MENVFGKDQDMKDMDFDRDLSVQVQEIRWGYGREYLDKER